MEKKYLIIPDVHGREFWKEPVKDWLENTDNPVIFLGDYLDPYVYEGVSCQSSLENFKEIVNIKEEFEDRVILLVGNHDWQYIVDCSSHSRFDYLNCKEIRNIFLNHASFFKLAHFDVVGDRNVIFSHAGINPSWLVHNSDTIFGDLSEKGDDELYSDITFETVKDRFDGADINTFKGNAKMLEALWKVSVHRGGSDMTSSFLWCDLFEMLSEDHKLNAIQIFGHSQREQNPVRGGDCYDLDCRRHFFLNADGRVIDSLSGEEVHDNGEDERKEYLKWLKAQMGFFL